MLNFITEIFHPYHQSLQVFFLFEILFPFPAAPAVFSLSFFLFLVASPAGQFSFDRSSGVAEREIRRRAEIAETVSLRHVSPADQQTERISSNEMLLTQRSSSRYLAACEVSLISCW
jgi:hypothetical protein